MRLQEEAGCKSKLEEKAVSPLPVDSAVFICKAVLRALIPDLVVTSEKRELCQVLIHNSAAKWFISKRRRSNVTN